MQQFNIGAIAQCMGRSNWIIWPSWLKNSQNLNLA